MHLLYVYIAGYITLQVIAAVCVTRFHTRC